MSQAAATAPVPQWAATKNDTGVSAKVNNEIHIKNVVNRSDVSTCVISEFRVRSVIKTASHCIGTMASAHFGPSIVLTSSGATTINPNTRGKMANANPSLMNKKYRRTKL